MQTRQQDMALLDMISASTKLSPSMEFCIFIVTGCRAKKKQARLMAWLNRYHLTGPVAVMEYICTYPSITFAIHHTHLQAPFRNFISLPPFPLPPPPNPQKYLSSLAQHINKSSPHTTPAPHPSHQLSSPNTTPPTPSQTIYRFHSIYRGPCGTYLPH